MRRRPGPAAAAASAAAPAGPPDTEPLSKYESPARRHCDGSACQRPRRWQLLRGSQAGGQLDLLVQLASSPAARGRSNFGGHTVQLCYHSSKVVSSEKGSMDCGAFGDVVSYNTEEKRLFISISCGRNVSEEQLNGADFRKFMAFCTVPSSGHAGPSRGEVNVQVSKKIQDNLDRALDIVKSHEKVSQNIVRACGARIGQSNMAYKCLDCGADPTCIMCVPCFLQSPCSNHRFRLVRSGDGTCDCGDPEAWNPAGFCKMHRSSHEAPWNGGDPNGRRLFAAVFRFAFDLNAPSCSPPVNSGLRADLLSWILQKAEAAASHRDAIAGALCLPAAAGGSDSAMESDPAASLLAEVVAAAVTVDNKGQDAALAVLLSLLPIYEFKAALGAVFAAAYRRVLADAAAGKASGSRLVTKISVQLLTVPSIAPLIAYGDGAAPTPADAAAAGLLPALLRFLRDTYAAAVPAVPGAGAGAWDSCAACSAPSTGWRCTTAGFAAAAS